MAKNDQGASPYSDILLAKTAPDVPAPCSAPRCRGEHAHKMELSWQSPESYGQPLRFSLEMRSSKVASARLLTCVSFRYGISQMEQVVYEGEADTCTIGDLRPATTYEWRVCASSVAGRGEFSDWVFLKTGPAVPAAPTTLWLNSRTASSVRVGWPQPDHHGASITGYKLESCVGEVSTIVYEGKETSFEVVYCCCAQE